MKTNTSLLSRGALWLCGLLTFTAGTVQAQLVTIDTVYVGNAGNAAANSTNASSWGSGYGYGAVGYDYRIGTNLVTNQQYTTFLNAVDSTGANSYGLWNSDMGADNRGGIQFDSMAANGSKYSVKTNFGNKPVNYVSFYDAAMFTNWLHNGATASSQVTSGAYTISIGGVTEVSRSSNVATLTSMGHTLSVGDQVSVNETSGYDGTRIVTAVTGDTFSFSQTGSDEGPTAASGSLTGASASRGAGATWWLPTEDEWVKAAYYDPATESYSLYATQSNTAPTLAIATANGDVSNPGSNVANYANGASWNSMTGNVSTVGSAGATSFYGTFDQSGNLMELNEAITGSSDRYRGYRGGSWLNDELQLRSSFRGIVVPSNGFSFIGFRVASIPEPSTIVLTLIVLGSVCLLGRRIPRKAA